MRLDITGRNVEITNPIRQLIDRRLARLERVLNDSAISATVILTKEKYRHRTEMIIHARGDRMMRGLGEGNAWPISMRQASEKIEQQAHKLKSKWAERKRKGAGARTVRTPGPAERASAGRRVVRATRYAVKPMSIEDAAMQVETAPEAFVVFRNADTEAVSILYRRKDGNFGLIEPD
jgi:putative sigma-54 modulation protein